MLLIIMSSSQESCHSPRFEIACSLKHLIRHRSPFPVNTIIQRCESVLRKIIPGVEILLNIKVSSEHARRITCDKNQKDLPLTSFLTGGIIPSPSTPRGIIIVVVEVIAFTSTISASSASCILLEFCKGRRRVGYWLLQFRVGEAKNGA